MVRAGQPLWDKVFLIVFLVLWFVWLAFMALNAELPPFHDIGLGMASRSMREERTFRGELSGYTDYMNRVRYRLVPGVW